MPETPSFLPVAQAYDRWAASYDAYDNPMVHASEVALGRRLPMAKGKRVAEIGCGTGRNLLRLKEAGAVSLWGCDFSSGMLREARARDAGFTLVQQDMTESLPLAQASIDFALVCLAFEHVELIAGPLAEIARVLTDEGQALLFEIHPFMAMSGVGAHFRDGKDEIHMPTFAHGFSDYLNAFREAGLVPESCREWRAGDFGDGAPSKLLKRGTQQPVLVEFVLGKA